MTSSKIERLDLSAPIPADSALYHESFRDHPVVYVLRDRRIGSDDPIGVYVGQSRNAVGWIRHHLQTPSMRDLKYGHVIINKNFNASICLDLASYLIRRLAGDGAYRVLNRNIGILESSQDRLDIHHHEFREIFHQLAHDGVFTRKILEIENSELFKLSPFKTLTEDQADAVHDNVRRLLTDVESGEKSTIVIQGDPGTGKTILAIYMIKMLLDIKAATLHDDMNNYTRFSEFFNEENKRKLQNFRVTLVVAQESLRKSILKVFRKTPGLYPSLVMTPFDIGGTQFYFDLILVDETHRLNQRANLSNAKLNKKFGIINTELFGTDDTSKTQLDWIKAKSRYQILFLDTAQSVMPADLPKELMSAVVADSQALGRCFQLQTQMRIQAGWDFVSYIRRCLNPRSFPPPPAIQSFGEYDFRMFDSFADMRDEIVRRDAEVGLSRMVAGYAWKWESKEDESAFDIELEGIRLRWNSTSADWIASSNVLEEVGFIHTVQGYDLNYVAVIIGLDLRFNPEERRLWLSRDSYFDPKGKEDYRILGKDYSDEDLLRFVTQIYTVLLTRGMRGTYVFVCDADLREYLRKFIPSNI